MSLPLEIKVEIKKKRERARETKRVWTRPPGMCLDRGATKGVGFKAIMKKTVLVY